MSFDSVLKPLFELLKQPLRFSIALGIVTGIVLFSPDSIMNRLGLLKYRNEGKLYLGAVFLVCIVSIIINAIGAGKTKYDHYCFLHTGKQRLHRLTIQEKQLLRRYIEGQTRSMNLDISSGVVKGLEAESIICRVSSVNNPLAGLTAFAYLIQPWAWDYLNEHRDLLGL